MLFDQFAKDNVKYCIKIDESTELCKKVAHELTPLAITMGFRGILKTGKLCESFCPKGFYTKLDLDREIDNIIKGNSIEIFEYINELPY